jgi:Na+-translocating ferredoxin:NAD+ oxidoreductase RnfG subunit
MPPNHPAWAALPLVVIAVPAHASVYLTVEQAQAALFPGETLTAAPVTLDDAQARAIEERSGVRVRVRAVRGWRSADGGLFIVDEVVGKHEFITYAAAFDAAGAVRGIEVLDYRETYGYEIRNAGWRAQFAGKTAADPLKLNADIRNISGATLSCKHITDGVKRLLATREIAYR